MILSGAYARLAHFANEFCVALNRGNFPRLKHAAGRPEGGCPHSFGGSFVGESGKIFLLGALADCALHVAAHFNFEFTFLGDNGCGTVRAMSMVRGRDSSRGDGLQYYSRLHKYVESQIYNLHVATSGPLALS